MKLPDQIPAKAWLVASGPLLSANGGSDLVYLPPPVSKDLAAKVIALAKSLAGPEVAVAKLMQADAEVNAAELQHRQHHERAVVPVEDGHVLRPEAVVEDLSQ